MDTRDSGVRALALAVLVVLSVATSAGPVTAADQPSGSLGQSTYTVTRGEPVDIGVSHSGPATLSVGGDDVGYRLRVNLSGSGSSTVTIHTYGSTNATASTYVDGGTPTVVDPASGGLKASLAPGQYRLEVAVANVTRDVGLLVVDPRPNATETVGVAPGGMDLGEADVETVDERTTRRGRVAKGDLAVFAFNVTGLGPAVDPDHLDGGPAAEGVRVHFEDRSPLPNRPKRSFDATDARAVTTRWDEERERLVVVWDTADVPLRDGTHRYDVSLSLVAANNELVREDVTEASGTITVVRPTVDLDLPPDVVVDPWDGRTLATNGTTNLAPTTDLEIRARGADPRPFLESATATVADNGTFATSFPLTGLPNGTTFPLFVLGHRDATTHDLTIHGDVAAFAFPNQTAENGRNLTFRNVTLGAGGYIVVGDWSGNETTIRGVTPFLEAGSHDNATLRLDPPLNDSDWVTARAVMDWNENRTLELTPPPTNETGNASESATANRTAATPSLDRVYRENGSAVQRTAVVWVAKPGANTTAPATTATTTTTTRATTTIPVERSKPLTPVPASGGVPLPLWVPVLAVLLAGLLARRGE